MEKPNDDDQDCYGLGSSLYDTISVHPEIDSRHHRFESFLDMLEMEFVNIMKSLCKKDTRHFPECNHALTNCLRNLAKDPDWSVVQLDKTCQWIPIWIADYINNKEIHLNHYSNEIPCSNLDQIFRDTNTLIEDINHLCSNEEVQFLKSWVKTRRILSMHLFIKDHKPFVTNGRHPM